MLKINLKCMNTFILISLDTDDKESSYRRDVGDALINA
jgi:hypothetical protein